MPVNDPHSEDRVGDEVRRAEKEFTTAWEDILRANS